MRKTIVVILAATVFLVAAAAEVSAQDVLMNSAETINQGNFKLALFPTVLFGKNGGDSVWGVAGRVGYGLTPRFDIEAKAAIFKDLKYFGVEAEYWLVQGRNANVSVALGAHMTDSQGGADSSGIDTSLLFSTKPARASGALRGPQVRLRFSQKLGSELHPGPSRAGARVPPSAPTSISWPSSASPSTTTPAAMSAWDWRYTFCAEASRLASRGASDRSKIRNVSNFVFKEN